jgi:hypothetical protein
MICVRIKPFDDVAANSSIRDSDIFEFCVDETKTIWSEGGSPCPLFCFQQLLSSSLHIPLCPMMHL